MQQIRFRKGYGRPFEWRGIDQVNDRSGTTIPASSRDRVGMGCVCYRPWTPSTPAARQCSIPVAVGIAMDDRGRDTSPPRAGDPREQPRLVSRPADARVGRRPARPPRAVPRQGRAVRQARRSGALLRAAHQIPCTAAPPTASRRARRPRSTRSRRGECVAVFPEGTISLDLEPMAGKSGTARLAERAGVPVDAGRAVGNAPACSPRAASRTGAGASRRSRSSVSRSSVGADEHVKHATDRIMDAICGCVARAREIYPQRPAPGTTMVVARTPRPCARTGGRHAARVAVVGAGSWGTAVAAIVAGQRADHALGAPARARRRDRRPHENPRTCRASRSPTALHATPSLEEACAGADVVVIGVPSHGFRAVLADAAPFIGRASRGHQPVEGRRAGHARAA